MYKVILNLDYTDNAFIVHFSELNELYKWLIPILVTENWTEYEIIDPLGNSLD